MIDFFLHEHETNSEYTWLSCKYCQNVILPVVPVRQSLNGAVVEVKSLVGNCVKVPQSSSDPSISQVLCQKYFFHVGTVIYAILLNYFQLFEFL